MKRRTKHRAQLLVHEKSTSAKGLIREIKVWRVPVSESYPKGIRYSMALVDPVRKESLLIFDNHAPKGPHIHWGNVQKPYEFESLVGLRKDFSREVDKYEKKNAKNKKN